MSTFIVCLVPSIGLKATTTTTNNSNEFVFGMHQARDKMISK